MVFDKEYLNYLEKVYNLPRHLISDGYDKALAYILEKARKIGLSTVTYTFPTGYDCGTWIIPQKWNLKRARLEDQNGKVLIDSLKDELACMSYSQSFEGWVTKEVLFEHLYTHPNIPDATPFQFSYYTKKWGLCCSEILKQTLNHGRYYVVIESEFENGHLQVGEIILEGAFEESFVLASHLCHPYQLNDGPIGVILGMSVLEKLSARRPNYTYRQLIVPETIGSAAWISKNKSVLPMIKAGLFIEMLTIENPFVLNYSFKGNTLIDTLFEKIVLQESDNNKCEPFNYGNDERQFNGANINIPMLALHRSKMSRYQKGNYEPYPEYHSNKDNMQLVTVKKLERAFDLIYKLLSEFDGFMVKPKANFIGEPFLGRYGLYENEFEEFCSKMDIINNLGSDFTVYEIANKLGIDMIELKKYFTMFIEKKLMYYETI